MSSFVKRLFNPRCDFCGESLLEQKVYTASMEISGLIPYTEEYDCVDCPKCGRQHLIGKRCRRVKNENN